MLHRAGAVQRRRGNTAGRTAVLVVMSWRTQLSTARGRRVCPRAVARSVSTATATVAVPRLARLFGGEQEQSPLTGAQALRAAADVLLNFMSVTRAQTVHDELAALRYLRLQELQADPTTGRFGLQRGSLVPTRDISAVWASDLLRPTDMAVSLPETQTPTCPAWYTHQQYRLLTSSQMFKKADVSWLRTIFGGASGVAVTPALARFDSDNDAVLTEVERSRALSEWTAQYGATADLWRVHTGTRYRLPRHIAWCRLQEPEPQLHLMSTMRDQISPERLEKLPQLLSGLRSQRKFTKRILNLGPAVVTNTWTGRAVERYQTFLALKAAHPEQTVVPTLDIDLIWHAHMLSPDDYIEDCELILGRVLPHDTGKAPGELTKSFHETQELWRKHTGEDMVSTVTIDPKTNKITKAAQTSPHSRQSSADGYAACGSCGFELSHAHLPHRHVEEAEIESAQLSSEKLSWADDSIGRDDWEESMLFVENAMGERVYTEELGSDSQSGSTDSGVSSSSSSSSEPAGGWFSSSASNESSGGWFSSSSDSSSSSSSSSSCSSCPSCGGD